MLSILDIGLSAFNWFLLDVEWQQRSCVCVISEFTTQLENTIQLNTEVHEQAQRRSDVLHAALDVTSKITDVRSLLVTGLKDAHDVLAQIDGSSDTVNPRDLRKKRNDLQVKFQHRIHS